MWKRIKWTDMFWCLERDDVTCCVVFYRMRRGESLAIKWDDEGSDGDRKSWWWSSAKEEERGAELFDNCLDHVDDEGVNGSPSPLRFFSSLLFFTIPTFLSFTYETRGKSHNQSLFFVKLQSSRCSTWWWRDSSLILANERRRRRNRGWIWWVKWRG